jgi:hypothetical protein
MSGKIERPFYQGLLDQNGMFLAKAIDRAVLLSHDLKVVAIEKPYFV